MILVTANQPKQLLYVHFIGQVGCEELKECRQELESFLPEFTPGFRLITDLSNLSKFEVSCASEIAKMMELLDEKEIGTVIRVIPDPSKDFGLTILALFHYRRPLTAITCKTLSEAADSLK